MDTLITLFNLVLYQPLLNILVFFYNIIPGHDIGIAIIVLTLVIRFLLLPLSHKSIKSQKDIQELQPEMDRIKEKYKDDRVKQSQALMQLYKEKRISPMGSCLPLLIQLPILIALYRVFISGLGNNLEALYPFIHHPETINPYFLGLIDLSKTHNFVLALIAGGLQFIQSKMMLPSKSKMAQGGKQADMSKMMNTQMTYFMPLITVWFAWAFPAGLALYWAVTTLFTIIQQRVMMKGKENRKQITENPK